MPGFNWGFIHQDINLDQFQTYTNNGILAACEGQTVKVQGSYAFESDLDTVVNHGLIAAVGNGSTLDIVATIHQQGGMIIAAAGGKVILDGNCDGGTIVISDGALSWGRLTRGPGPEGCASTTPIAFTGTSGVIETGVQGLSLAFHAATQDIAVIAPRGGIVPGPTQIADIHLTGRAYTAADFSVQGSTIVFNPIHAAT